MRQHRRAVAAHLGEQKLLGTRKPFDLDAFKKKYPMPDSEAHDVLIGHAGQAGYLGKLEHYRSNWFMDVGGARGMAPFNVFHVGVLDGNHHCHGMDTFLVDAESKEAYTPILAGARARNPMLDQEGARCIKDDHKGANAAFAATMKNCVPLSCIVRLAPDRLFIPSTLYPQTDLLTFTCGYRYTSVGMSSPMRHGGRQTKDTKWRRPSSCAQRYPTSTRV